MTRLASRYLTIMLVYALTTGQAGDPSPTVATFAIVRDGVVDYRADGPGHNKFGDPYRYLVIPWRNIVRTIEDAVQDLGFSLNPTSWKRTIPECAIASVTAIWTNYLALDSKMLGRFSTSITDIRLQDDPNIFYELQIVGCYSVKQDGQGAVSSAGIYEDARNYKANALQTEVQLTLTAIVRKRGRLSDFFEEERGDPKPIVDGLKSKIIEASKRIPYEEYLIIDKKGNMRRK